MPAVCLLSPELSDITVREFAYNRISMNIGSDMLEVNSWAYLKEEQDGWLKIEDAIDSNPFNDLVRGIGWCDQKSWLVQTILDRRGIKSRLMMFPCHTLLEVVDGERLRYLDPAFNCEVFYNNGKYGDQEYKGKCINDYSCKYSGYYDGVHCFIGKFMATYPDLYVDKWVDLYLNGKSVLYSARVYHLFNRVEEARDRYVQLISTDQCDQALYFLATLQLDQGDFDINCQPPNGSYLELLPLYKTKLQDVKR